MLGLLAACSLIASDLPRLISVPTAVMAAAYGAWLARRELLRPIRGLVIPAGDTAATIDGHAMDDLQLQWRGPLAFLRWRDGGRRRHLQGWPDVLTASARRELRLAMMARTPVRPSRSMAP